MPSTRRVLVVGGGASGLAAAYFLRTNGGPDVEVTLVESAGRLGGKVLTQEISGHPVDAGPDALLVRVPAMAALLADLGLSDAVVGPGAQRAFVWSRGRLRPLPPSSLFGVPQRILPLLRSGLLSPSGAARAAFDLVLPRRRDAGDARDAEGADRDLSVGELLRPRLGTQVFDRLVEPLLGGVHAGRADELSARSAVPEVHAVARAHRSIYLGTRRRPGPSPADGPALVTLDGGLTRLVDALAAACAGCTIELGAQATALSKNGDGTYSLRLADGRRLNADAVVLATPAYVTAELLGAVAPEASAALAQIPYADVASVTLRYARDAVPRALDGTGFLVPPSEGLLLVGCSWLTAKWPHLADPSSVLVRGMVGRAGDTRFTTLDDAQLVAQVHAELVLTMGMTAPPEEASVQRWPRAMPQYTVGHRDRLDRIDAALAALPGVTVTGAAYRGVGVASCVGQAERTAAAVLAAPPAAGRRAHRPAVDYGQRPMLVFWETTRACQVACRHCRASALTHALPGELTPAEGIDLVDQVAGFGRPYPILVLTGGDCLLRADLFDLVEHAKSLGVPVALSPSVTPALSAPMVERIAGSGVKAVSVSLDGASAATHEGVRAVEHHFEDTVAAIEALVAAGLTVQVNTTVMRENLHDLADIAALVQRTGAHIWEVFFLVHVGRGAVSGAISPQEHEDVCHFLVDASQHGFVLRTVEAPFFRRVVTERRAGGAVPQTGTYRALADRLVLLLGPPTARSSAHTAATRDGKGILFVAHDGVVYPAGFLPVGLGNLRERPLREIYRDDPLLRQIRAAEFSGRCGACEYADLCGGSRARAYAATGDPLGEDPACTFVPRGVAQPVG